MGDHMGIEANVSPVRDTRAVMLHARHWMAKCITAIEGNATTGISAVDALVAHVALGQAQISGVYRDPLCAKIRPPGNHGAIFRVAFHAPLESWAPSAGSQMAS